MAFFIRFFFFFGVIHEIESTNAAHFYDYTPDNKTATTKPPKAFFLISVLDLPTPLTPPIKSTHKTTIPEVLELER